MSQQKVDRYKEDKRNRDKLIKKEKREWLMTKIGLSVVGIALVCWIGVSAYNLTQSTDTASDLPTYTVNMTAVDNYINSLSSD